jgi:uncharacterized SAM-binding protein YcdF (DUF218 family)
MDEIDENAKIIWNYMRLNMPLKKSDLILGLGSHDVRTAEYAAKLYQDGYAPLILFSGYEGVGRRISGFEGTPEAEKYEEEAIKLGVPSAAILTESKSRNTGENILFSSNLLAERKIKIERMIVLHKPYMERRTYATFKAQWPKPQPDIIISSVDISFDKYLKLAPYSKDYTLNVMVGDLQRIKEYPRLGFQIEQEIPDRVWRAYEFLVQTGYNKHLIISS